MFRLLMFRRQGRCRYCTAEVAGTLAARADHEAACESNPENHLGRMGLLHIPGTDYLCAECLRRCFCTPKVNPCVYCTMRESQLVR